MSIPIPLSMRIQSDRDTLKLEAHEPRGLMSRGAVVWGLLLAFGRIQASAL